MKLQAIIQSIIPDMKKYRQYMGIYMLDKSGQQLFQEVSKQNLYDISLKIQKTIGKAKKKKKKITALSKENNQKTDAEFFAH
jgi:hypothetical protein